MSNKKNGTLYTGVTSNLEKRVKEHKTGFYKGFSHKYHCIFLVRYEEFPTIGEAIEREKILKGGSRKKKIDYIQHLNPGRSDLAENWC